MNSIRCFRRAMLALVPVAAISLSIGFALAQSRWRSRQPGACPDTGARGLGIAVPYPDRHAGAATRRKQIARR